MYSVDHFDAEELDKVLLIIEGLCIVFVISVRITKVILLLGFVKASCSFQVCRNVALNVHHQELSYFLHHLFHHPPLPRCIFKIIIVHVCWPTLPFTGQFQFIQFHCKECC